MEALSGKFLPTQFRWQLAKLLVGLTICLGLPTRQADASPRQYPLAAMIELPCSDKVSINPQTIIKECSTELANSVNLPAKTIIDLRLCRARAFSILERHAEALQDYEEILKIDPKNVEARFRHANAELNLELYQQGIKELKLLINELPEFAPAYGNLAAALADTRKILDAKNMRIKHYPLMTR